MKVLVALVIGFSLIGCGHTIIQTNNPQALIFVDGDYVGQGRAKIRSIGPPNTAQIRVVVRGQAIEQNMEREFRVSTAVIGLFTYLTGLYWAWQYPDRIMIRVEEPESGFSHSTKDAWSVPQKTDVWSSPLYVHPKKTPKPKPNLSQPDS